MAPRPGRRRLAVHPAEGGQQSGRLGVAPCNARAGISVCRACGWHDGRGRGWGGDDGAGHGGH